MPDTTSQTRVDYSRSRVGRRIQGFGPRPRGAAFPTIELEPARKVGVRIFADYQIFGDIETDDWLKRTEDNPELDNVEITSVGTGAFGLRFVTLMVDAGLTAGDEAETYEKAHELLAKAVFDDDIHVRFISKL